MNKKMLVILSITMLILLVCANIYRYDNQSSTEGLIRYTDRWTGLEWVKVISPTGVSRYPAKYYNNNERLEIPTEEVLKDLWRIGKINDILYTAWYALLIGFSVLAAYGLVKINRQLKGTSGGL